MLNREDFELKPTFLFVDLSKKGLEELPFLAEEMGYKESDLSDFVEMILVKYCSEKR